MVRTEQAYGGGAWANDNKLTYQYDALERQYYEQRHDWALGAWAARFDTTQEYDKNGNRTRYHRNTAANFATSYGQSEDLSYTYNSVNSLTAAADADVASYSATFTCDQNGNITQVDESEGPNDTLYGKSVLHTYFDYDTLNKLSAHRTKAWNTTQNDWRWTKRSHNWDAVGRLVASNYKQWWDQGSEPSGDSLEHVYSGARHVQNYDGSSSYGTVWHWAGAEDELTSPLRSPNPDTASQKGYNISSGYTPQRRTFQNPTTEGDKRQFYAQGRPEAKDSSGGGTNWYLGTQSQPRSGSTQGTTSSRFFFTGTVTATDMSRATDTREGFRVGFLGSSNSYNGSSGRVAAESIGRDLNPLGRGDGMAYLAGAVRTGWLAPEFPISEAISGSGNSINNDGGYVIGGDGREDPRFTCCYSNCCNGTVACIRGVSSINPPPQVCPMPCTWEECGADRGRCVRRCCERIACGCARTDCRIIDGPFDNCHLFTRCGCEKFGSCKSSRGFCQKGEFTSRPARILSTIAPACGGIQGLSESGAIAPKVEYAPDCQRKGEQWKQVARANFATACAALLSCSYLSSDVKACLRTICSGSSTTIYVFCTGGSCDGVTPAYSEAAMPGAACFGRISLFSLVLCYNHSRSNSTDTLAHELLHYCDCEYAHSGGFPARSKQCTAYFRDKPVDSTGKEAFAEACSNCCLGRPFSNTSYTFDDAPGVSPCCLCCFCY